MVERDTWEKMAHKSVILASDLERGGGKKKKNVIAIKGEV